MVNGGFDKLLPASSESFFGLRVVLPKQEDADTQVYRSLACFFEYNILYTHEDTCVYMYIYIYVILSHNGE